MNDRNSSTDPDGSGQANEPTGSNQGELRDPTIFISHKHIAEVDVKIADAVRRFFEHYSGNRIKVFQSSEATASLAIGDPVTEQLMLQLKESEVVVLIYTQPDHDWSFCMWETGVALDPDPDKPNTRIAVLVCGSKKPDVFRDQEVTYARERESVRKFVIQALTDADFFPVSQKSLTNYTADARGIDEIVNSFYDQLEQLMPPEEEASQWDFWPMVLFELGFDCADQVSKLYENFNRKSEDEKRAAEESALALIRGECKVYEDQRTKASAQLFRRNSINGTTLEDLGALTPTDPPAPITMDWTQMLGEQISSSIRGEWPDDPSCRMYEDWWKKWRIPMLVNQTKIPAEKRYLFQVCLVPFPSNGDWGMRKS